jgi:hypothetical protein
MNTARLRLLFRYANLLAAARAALSAEHDGEPDPMWYLRDELRATGHLPPGLDGPAATTRDAQ